MNERYAQLLDRFRTVQLCLSGPELDSAYFLMHESDKKGHISLREDIENEKLDILERICISGEERKQIGFDNFSFGTAIDRLVNKGLYGIAKESRVSFVDLLKFRKMFFDEETGRINDEIKRKVIQSGMSAGKYRPGHWRYFSFHSRNRTKDEIGWIKQRYENAFSRFEEYLASIGKDVCDSM